MTEELHNWDTRAADKKRCRINGALSPEKGCSMQRGPRPIIQPGLKWYMQTLRLLISNGTIAAFSTNKSCTSNSSLSLELRQTKTSETLVLDYFVWGSCTKQAPPGQLLVWWMRADKRLLACESLVSGCALLQRQTTSAVLIKAAHLQPRH